MKDTFTRVIAGQILLVICCIFYLIWWSISYRPHVSVNREGGINGILLILMCCVIAAAFAVSMILYVLYYRMEEMRAFYAAMVPLITEAVSMGVLIICLL